MKKTGIPIIRIHNGDPQPVILCCQNHLSRFKGHLVSTAKTLNYLFFARLPHRPAPKMHCCSRQCLTGEISNRPCKSLSAMMVASLFPVSAGAFCYLLKQGVGSYWLNIAGAVTSLFVPAYFSFRTVQQSGQAISELLDKREHVPFRVTLKSTSSRCINALALTAAMGTEGALLLALSGSGAMFYLQGRFLMTVVTHAAIQGFLAFIAAHLEGRRRKVA